jgi:predicted transcriptional regulator
MSLKKFSIAVDEDKVKDLDEISEKEDRKRNWLINKAIEEYIQKYKESNK